MLSGRESRLTVCARVMIAAVAAAGVPRDIWSECMSSWSLPHSRERICAAAHRPINVLSGRWAALRIDVRVVDGGRTFASTSTSPLLSIAIWRRLLIVYVVLRSNGLRANRIECCRYQSEAAAEWSVR